MSTQSSRWYLPLTLGCCGFLCIPLLGDEEKDRPVVSVHRTKDFQVTGDGSRAAWKLAKWTPLNRRGDGGHDYEARFKVLYSETGVYFLLNGTDKRLTATFTKDFENLWTEDVFEVFLWTDENQSIYFEYEISPLNKELPIIVPNFNGKFFGWLPWHYEGARKTKKAVSITGGPQASGASIQAWTAEVFFPYDLFKPLQNVPPKPGTRWRANVYRVDYDDQTTTQWDWARVGPSFHEFRRFGTLTFQ